MASGKVQTQPTHMHMHTHMCTVKAGCHFVCLNGFFFNALARSSSIINLKDDYLAQRFATRGDSAPQGTSGNV